MKSHGLRHKAQDLRLKENKDGIAFPLRPEPCPSRHGFFVLQSVDFRQGEKDGRDQRAVDNSQNAKELHSSEDGEKHEKGVHPHFLSNQSGFDQVFHGGTVRPIVY
jgi:hypothetical protein